MEGFWAFLGDVSPEAGTIGVGLALLLALLGGFKVLRGKKDEVNLGPETIEKIAPSNAKAGPTLTVPEFIRLRRQLKEDLVEELAQAHEEEKDQLRARITALEEQLADPEQALAEERKRIEELEDLLERSGNQIGGERIDGARAALERGDYSIADDLFSEVEAARELDVQEAARAAFGRGEIAEAEIRWADAAKHYARAARLDQSYEHLSKAQDLAERSGNYAASEMFGDALLRITDEIGDLEKRSNALNLQAITLQQSGRFEEAEMLCKKALEIGKATIGEQHPNYAIYLNNLASVVRAQSRFEEAEALYKEALEIDKATIGERHPDYAISLTNLAGSVEDQGRFEEAEALYKEALKIGKATIGEWHPDYAARLNNLANVVRGQGRIDEAEVLYREAIAIAEARLGVEHPDTMLFRANLERLLTQMEDEG